MSEASGLAGQGAIVTGASTGIGAAIALTLAAQGADLALVGRNVAAIQPAEDAIRAQGRSARVLACDLSDSAQVARMAAQAHALFGNRIDILVNAAGGTGGVDTPIWETSEADFTRLMTRNLTTSFLTMAAVLPFMIARRSGRVVNIGGTYGLRGRAGRAAYSAAKWGLRGLTKSAALEVGAFDITVNCICPGMVEGPAMEAASAQIMARTGLSREAARAQIARTAALRRVSTPEDIANTVCFLVGESGRQMTGQDLVIDGG